MDRSKISWTDATWNPVIGCSRVSEGCRNCYAERVAGRFCGLGQPYEGVARRVAMVSSDGLTAGRWTGDVRVVERQLAKPLRWRRPRRIFVNSMSDLFHEKLTNEQIAGVFGVMAAAPQHTFQILTKRAKRMSDWFAWLNQQTSHGNGRGDTHAEVCRSEASMMSGTLLYGYDMRWPLPNVWLGVSVENQAAADDRIPDLLSTPAAVRFLSCEPLLEHVDLFAFLRSKVRDRSLRILGADGPLPGVDWVIAGCESGPRARSCDTGWLRALRDQCATAGVPFFLKQAEEHTLDRVELPGGMVVDQIGYGTNSKRKAGGVIELPYLDGVQHTAFPTASALRRGGATAPLLDGEQDRDDQQDAEADQT